MRCLLRIAISGMFLFGVFGAKGWGTEKISLKPPVFLPDGQEFKTWERPVEFTKTWYVNQGDVHASDDHPGTVDRPFKTINRAAQILRPGERVVIAAGVYREQVCPVWGGTGPDRMISYEAAPGAEVVLSGSRIITNPWVRIVL